MIVWRLKIIAHICCAAVNTIVDILLVCWARTDAAKGMIQLRVPQAKHFEQEPKERREGTESGEMLSLIVLCFCGLTRAAWVGMSASAPSEPGSPPRPSTFSRAYLWLHAGPLTELNWFDSMVQQHPHWSLPAFFFTRTQKKAHGRVLTF